MKISLRPHHLLCLKGYKGLNYNQTQIMEWSKVSLELEKNSDIDILIIDSCDDLCQKCPAIVNNKNLRCKTQSVEKLDNAIKSLIGIVAGNTYKYKELTNKLNEIMTFDKHKNFCSNCCWWKKGLCQDSFIKK